MTRETYVYREGLGVVAKQEAPPALDRRKSVQVMADIGEFVTQDGVRITSRSGLRAYEQSRGVRQVGNDWPGSERPAWYGNKDRTAC